MCSLFLKMFRYELIDAKLVNFLFDAKILDALLRRFDHNTIDITGLLNKRLLLAFCKKYLLHIVEVFQGMPPDIKEV